MKEVIKKVWKNIKLRDPKTLLMIAGLSILPSFIYTIVGSIFGIVVTGFYDLPLILIILMIPCGIIFLYYLIFYIGYIMIWKWLLKQK